MQKIKLLKIKLEKYQELYTKPYLKLDGINSWEINILPQKASHKRSYKTSRH